MARQVAFTKHEAALLLDAYLKVLSGELSRMDSVKECSRMLRLMAVNSGFEIDDIYRNVNGISFQMASMESAYQGRTIMKPATRLFTEMVNLFMTDKKGYQKLLKEAKNMADTKQNNEVAFMSWLNKTVSAAQLSELYMALIEIEQQAKKAKLVKDSLYDNLKLSAIKKIRANVEQSKIFKFTHKRQWGHIISALNYLLQYANSNSVETAVVQQPKEDVHAEATADSAPANIAPEEPVGRTDNQNNTDTNDNAKKYTAEVSHSNDAITTVNFTNIGSLAFTKPISISYFGDVRQESSWKGLYVDACRFLLEDYPDTFDRMMKESISGKGKTWLVDERHLDMLAVPKLVTDNRYVETNRSALDLVKNLKWIMDECSANYEDVVVVYSGKEETTVAQESTPKHAQLARQYYREDKENFYQWLKEDQHMAEGSCRSYVSAIRSAERFAEEHGLSSKRLYTSNVDEAKATADALFTNSEFIQYNSDQHNRFRAAIAKLLSFFGSNWSPSRKSATGRPQKKKSTIDAAPYVTILIEHFSNGYRLESALDLKRLRRYYEELTGSTLTAEQSTVESAIRDCGIVYEGRLYMPQTMLSIEMRERLLSFIERCFDEGRTAVYYEALFREFSDALLDHHIYNSDMLKAYLSYCVGDKYYMGRSYLSKGVRTEVNPIDEVRQCLKQYDTPVQVKDVCDSLSHIAEDRVRYILGSNGEFVRNSKGEYFHVDALDLTDEELENIAAIIDSVIEEHEFISGNELYEAIQNKYPYIFEKNAAFSVIGWRDALKYRIGDRFSFVGNIISRTGTSLSMSEVFAEFGKSRARFSIEELKQFADSIGTTIYFDSLYTNSVRISHQWFVAKSSAKFSVKETDTILERFCDGKYMSLSSVTEFATFPNASYPWTEYLLEQYVAYFSEKFYLLHGNYNKNCAVGAIVRKTCRFNSFDELVTDILAHSDIPFRKKEVLDYLAENGYIARRSYTNIEALIINARAKRNQKEKK